MTEPYQSVIRVGAPARDDIVAEPLDGETYSEQVGTRITPEMHAIMLHIINNENTGYRGSASRFIRHAIYELEIAWGMKLPTDTPVSNWVTWDLPQRERELELRRLLKFRGWLSVFETAIRGYIADGDPNAVAEEILEIERFILGIRGTNAIYWRRKCLSIVASAPAIVDGINYLTQFPMYEDIVQKVMNGWGLV